MTGLVVTQLRYQRQMTNTIRYFVHRMDLQPIGLPTPRIQKRLFRLQVPGRSLHIECMKPNGARVVVHESVTQEELDRFARAVSRHTKLVRPKRSKGIRIRTKRGNRAWLRRTRTRH